MQPKKKNVGGRPKSEAHMVLMAFKIDAETLAMLDDLCADMLAKMGASTRAGAIRQAIRIAHAGRSKPGTNVV